MSIRSLQIVTITRDSTMQPREQINQNAVHEYAEAFRAGAKPDPIGVVTDGETHWVWDGFHRIAAFEELGRASIDCDVTDGTRLDAIRLSLGANAHHGQRRTNEDKRRAVLRALSVPEWNEGEHAWTLQKIADECGVSAPFVKSIKDQLLTDKSSKSSPKKALGKDGKKRPTKYNTKPKDSKTTRVSHLDQDGTATQDVEAAPQDGEGEATPGRQEADPVRHDSVGNVLPGSLYVTFDAVSTYKDLDSRLDGVIRLVTSLAEQVGGEWLKSPSKSILQRLREARQDIKYAMPYALCPSCNGKGCNHCVNRGYVGKDLHERLVKACA